VALSSEYLIIYSADLTLFVEARFSGGSGDRILLLFILWSLTIVLIIAFFSCYRLSAYHRLWPLRVLLNWDILLFWFLVCTVEFDKMTSSSAMNEFLNVNKSKMDYLIKYCNRYNYFFQYVYRLSLSKIGIAIWKSKVNSVLSNKGDS